MFLVILLGGLALVALQVYFADKDGFLTQDQMRARGVTNGWSLLEHGGWWSDIFYISPMTAFFASAYELGYLTWYGLLILVAVLVTVYKMGCVYAEGGKKTPEAHTHDGYTTSAGWIHGLFAVGVMWTLALVYVTPKVSPRDMIILSISLVPFFFVGVVKFSRRWKFDRTAKMQVAAIVAVDIIATAIHLIVFY